MKLERRASQGHNISPKLFTAWLQDSTIRKISWNAKEINIDGEHLSYQICADDIVLIARSPQELQEMLSDIHNFSRAVGPNMHLGKPRVMLNNYSNKAQSPSMEQSLRR